MGSSPTPAFISVVVTVKNEGPRIARLLDSLLVQEPPFEVVVTDALSHDRTWPILQEYAQKNPELIRIFRKYGSRGIGRNTGVAAARGEFVAFIDGDCFADSNWLRELRSGLATSDIAATQALLGGSISWLGFELVIIFTTGWIVLGARWLVDEGRGVHQPEPLPPGPTSRY